MLAIWLTVSLPVAHVSPQISSSTFLFQGFSLKPWKQTPNRPRQPRCVNEFPPWGKPSVNEGEGPPCLNAPISYSSKRKF